MKAIFITLAAAFAIPLGGCGSGSEHTGYSIGGRIEGIQAGTSITLSLNDGLPKVLTTAGSFAFEERLQNGTPYRTTIVIAPASHSCSSLYGAGTVDGRDVRDIEVFCNPVAGSNAYSASSSMQEAQV